MEKTDDILRQIPPRLHDVNNCLASILTSVEVLALEESSQAETAEYLENIRTSTQRAYELVNALMTKLKEASAN